MQTTEWIHPVSGETRRYLDPAEVWDAMPAQDPNGFQYKGADMDRVLSAKYWIDQQGFLQISGLVERGRIRESDVRDAIWSVS